MGSDGANVTCNGREFQVSAAATWNARYKLVSETRWFWGSSGLLNSVSRICSQNKIASEKCHTRFVIGSVYSTQMTARLGKTYLHNKHKSRKL